MCLQCCVVETCRDGIWWYNEVFYSLSFLELRSATWALILCFYICSFKRSMSKILCLEVFSSESSFNNGQHADLHARLMEKVPGTIGVHVRTIIVCKGITSMLKPFLFFNCLIAHGSLKALCIERIVGL